MPAVRGLAAVGLCVFVAAPAAAQTIRPLRSEFRNKARGKVELVNDAAWPLAVYLQPRSFSVSDTGDMTDRTLDPDVHVKLSAMSARIPPGQSRWIFYEATADHMPAWFVLYAVFAGFPARDFKGVNVQVELPHIVYILPKDPLKGADLHVSVVDFRPADHALVLDVENTGAEFGRILTTELRGPDLRAVSPGFPMFPHGRRRLVLPWNAEQMPARLVLKSRDFVVDQTLTAAAP
jgi:hypothetical protein